MAEHSRIELAVPDGSAMAGHVRELENGTLFLRSSANPHVGEIIEVAMMLPGAPAPLVVSGKVSRIENDGFGLALDPLPEAALIIIAATRELESPKDLAAATRRIERLSADLLEAREKTVQLQREAETNRAFYARALTQATGPSKGGGPKLGHVLAMGFGVGVGVVFTLFVLVARLPPPAPAAAASVTTKPSTASPRSSTALPVPVATVPTATVRDAGASGADAGAGVIVHRAAESARPGTADDSGTLNLIANGVADVFVDGRHIGRSPVKGVSVRPGEHSVRFSCSVDASRSAERSITVPPFAEVDVEHTCE